MTVNTTVAVCGMVLDVLGAFVLARSFVMKRPRDVFRELRSLGTWDFHVTIGARDLMLSWLVQAIEARTGAIVIAMGFLLQAIAQLLPGASLGYGGVVLVAAAALVAVWLFFVLQAWFVRHAAHQALGFYRQLEPEAKSEDWKREIPLRCDELTQIKEHPRKWLASEEGTPIDSTLTSND